MTDLLDLARYPTMTRWFDPALLVRLAVRVFGAWTSSRYADRRLVIAALDQVPLSEQLARADMREVLRPDAEGAIWLDYVSDLGDGFDATYALAWSLARETIAIGGHTLPRGGVLVMGGDEVYPAASHDEYNLKLRAPYDLAFPRDSDGPSPHVYLIPGNHDWYDGLIAFYSLFCRSKPTEIGHWRTYQRRSYFALELAPGWWLWAIDIALTIDMDQPQADYFVAITEAMPNEANIILCTAQPGWYGSDRAKASFKSLDYAAWLADNARRGDDPEKSKNLRIVVVLSGDSHHYARYAAESGMQFVTAGGGGAFLHGTQSLKDRVSLDWLKARDSQFRLATCWPSQAESRMLLAGNWAFAMLNKRFSALLGALYGLIGLVVASRPHPDAYILCYLLMSAGLVGYAAKQVHGVFEKPIWLALAHAAVHGAAILGLVAAAGMLNGWLFGEGLSGWPFVFATFLAIALPGSIIAGTIFGANYWFCARFFELYDEDAFGTMRLTRNRHWLRLRIQGDSLTIFPVGLSRIPERSEWRLAANVPDSEKDAVASAYWPPHSLNLHLIEQPVVIHGGSVTPIVSAAKPEELQAATPGQEPAKGDG